MLIDYLFCRLQELMVVITVTLFSDYYVPNVEIKDAYILVTGNIAVTGGDNNTKVAFKNCASFRKYRIELNETFVDDAEH